MAFWRVRRQIRLEAGHVLGRSSAPGVHFVQYCETARTVTRPAHGRAEHGISCGHCGHVVSFTVLSVALTRRHRMIAYGIGVLLLGAVVLLYAVGIDAVIEADTPVWALLLTVAEIALIMLSVLLLAYAAVHEYGVRAPGLWPHGARHDGHLAMIDPDLGRKPSARNGRAISSVHRHPPDEQLTIPDAD
ncbi:hypothetical protein [Plantactinospora endophytica]|uniref:DUF983 domain-containing protein n=1 Tax=Plantactinospora endophytica TaxID=673535 RepID=A0ABQ4DTN6_9ACTN|nr:hypothetical protein [Plantactinospora endophytica]GIG85487.1 hypothetical protein Pen02_04230 [Plantactinospora endophytica]